MTWFKVDDQLPDHRKVRRLGKDRLPAVGLWALCGSWAADNLTDGFVPTEVVQRWDPTEQYAHRLVEVGFWEVAEQDGEPGYQYHDWNDHQPTRTDVLAKRDAARERMRKVRGDRSSRSREQHENVRNEGSNGGSGDPGFRANNDAGYAERNVANFAGSSEDVRANTHGTAGQDPNVEPPDNPVRSDVRANTSRSSQQVRLTPSRPVPSSSSSSNSSSAATAIADALGLKPDDDETTKILELIHADHQPTAIGPYVRTLAANGDLRDYLDRVRGNRASPAAADAYTGPTHAFEPSATRGDTSCAKPGCFRPRKHACHRVPAP